ncbi:uncharacterized protein LOC129914890 [Episyrphus balteatus]|uniref:uncharacterized protein LOC129914890 n=1 Tax=Episyrphus balteatus TaxID=286459 RepID=UPI0024859E25|nr:uncharacterized protein LOC129914890 [Episyrphus balteatus]
MEYIESEKIWRAPKLDVKISGLGADILEKLKQSDPEKIYEIHHDSGTHVTFRQIREQTITVAQNLLNLGVKKNHTVVFFTMMNLKITPLTFACYTIGAPLCFFETYLEEEFIPQYLELLDPDVIIYEDKFKSMVFKALKVLSLPKLKHILTLDGKEQQRSVDNLLFKPKVDIENFQVPHIEDPNTQPAILCFTSGSTDLPKIVIHSHTIMRESVYGRWQVQPGSVIMILSEIRWSCQISGMMHPAFLDVKKVYSSIPPNDLSGEFVKEIIDTHKVTHYFDVPQFLISVLEAAERSQDPSSLSSLKWIKLGGENTPEAIERDLAKINPNCKIGRCYGMTELVGGVALSELANRQNVNGGVLRKGCMVKIIGNNKNSLGPNEIGKMCFKSTAPFLGYLKNQKANENAFIDGGWLNSEDLGMVDSENILHAFTRKKYVLRYANGKILLPSDIENIVNKFEGVRTSALVGKPSLENPEEDCGTIFVVFKNSFNIINLENDLRDYIRKNLTKDLLHIVRYFKIVEDLPRTICIKVDKVAMKGMLDGGYYPKQQLILNKAVLKLYFDKQEEIYDNLAYNNENVVEINFNNEVGINNNIGEFIESEHLSEHEKGLLYGVLKKFKRTFYNENDDLSFTNEVKHHIHTKHELPVYSKLYRYPEVHRDEVDRQIEEMLKQGIIRESNSPFNSPIWVVPKKEDLSGKKQWRIVIDYRKLNEITIEDRQPMPNIEEIFDKLGRCQYFTTLDLAKGFHQIEMHHSDIHKTAFSTSNGHYEFLRMPFGLHTPTRHNDIVHVDIWFPMRNVMYLTTIDKLTKYATADLLEDRTWISITKALKTRMQYLGKPKLIVTDNELDTVSIRQFLTSYDIQLHVTTPYLKTGNADIERLHSTFNEHIRLFNADPCNEDSLDEKVFKAVVLYNNTIHTRKASNTIELKINPCSTETVESMGGGVTSGPFK